MDALWLTKRKSQASIAGTSSALCTNQMLISSATKTDKLTCTWADIKSFGCCLCLRSHIMLITNLHTPILASDTLYEFQISKVVSQIQLTCSRWYTLASDTFYEFQISKIVQGYNWKCFQRLMMSHVLICILYALAGLAQESVNFEARFRP